MPSIKSNWIMIISGLKGSGKTYWLEHTLVPLLRAKRQNYTWIKEAKDLPDRIQPRTFFIYDDCDVYMDRFTKDETLRQICLRGRHIDQGAAFVTHHPTHIPEYVRMNADAVIVFQHTSEAASKYFSFWFPKHWIPAIPTLQTGESFIWTKHGVLHQKGCGRL